MESQVLFSCLFIYFWFAFWCVFDHCIFISANNPTLTKPTASKTQNTSHQIPGRKIWAQEMKTTAKGYNHMKATKLLANPIPSAP